MSTIQFIVHGTPRPAGSKRAFPIKRGGVFTGKVAVTDASGAAGRNWRSDVKAEAVRAMEGRPPMEGPLRLSARFYLPRPKSHFRNGPQSSGKGPPLRPGAPARHSTRPDATKLLRAVEDALTGIVWKDDAQVATQHVAKNYAPGGPFVVVTVSQLDAEVGGMPLVEVIRMEREES